MPDSTPHVTAAPRETLFPTLTDADIDCLRPYAREVTLDAGARLFTEGDPEGEFYVVLDGRVKITRALGTGEGDSDDVVLTVHGPGEFTGALSFLTGEASIASAHALEPTRLLRVDRDGFARALPACSPTVRRILTAMAARRPEADAHVFQREKLAALGKMAAGLAHELNNPAAAAQRALSELPARLATLEERSLALGPNVAPDAAARLAAVVREASERAASAPALSPLQRGDREDELAAWLEARGASDPYTDAATLADAGLAVDDLEAVAALVAPAAVSDALCWLEARVAVDTLTREAAQSVGRLSETVAAVKAYTFMDRGPRQEAVDVRAGLDSTLAMLGHELRRKAVKIEKRYAPDLPPVPGAGGELNQVWTNLIHNALDALPGDGSGRLTLSAEPEDGCILVTVADNGHGIPPEVMPHLFEPFYTTKAQGEGTGLGLDTAYRIVTARHRGTIRAVSEPGAGARFEVRLPTRDATAETAG